jgi:hypothetical protein
MHNLAQYVRVYDDVFSPEFCNEMIEVFEKQKAAESETMRLSHHKWEQDYRRFVETDITKDAQFAPFINAYYERVQEVYAHYKSVVDIPFFPTNYAFEDARMKKYEANDLDQFGWHVDVGDKHSAERFLVMFTYLNDVEEGGHTRFQSEIDFTIQPKQGRIVIFPPMWMYPHIGEKPISGPKYIISTYVHYV